MKRKSRIQFADEKIRSLFHKLENGDYQEKELAKFLAQAFENLEENAFCGVQIRKKLIPKEYITKFDIRNLWKYDLPRGWRLLYSIIGSEVIVISLVLEWMNHKDYEKRLRY